VGEAGKIRSTIRESWDRAISKAVTLKAVLLNSSVQGLFVKFGQKQEAKAQGGGKAAVKEKADRCKRR
jgi:hypothetical protein